MIRSTTASRRADALRKYNEQLIHVSQAYMRLPDSPYYPHHTYQPIYPRGVTRSVGGADQRRIRDGLGYRSRQAVVRMLDRVFVD